MDVFFNARHLVFFGTWSTNLVRPSCLPKSNQGSDLCASLKAVGSPGGGGGLSRRGMHLGGTPCTKREKTSLTLNAEQACVLMESC